MKLMLSKRGEEIEGFFVVSAAEGRERMCPVVL